MKEKIRILYVGALFNGSTDLERCDSLIRLGHEIIKFDTSKYRWQSSEHEPKSFWGYLERRGTYKLAWGPHVWAINCDLLKFAKTLKYDLVWISKGIWFYPETIRSLRRQGKARVLHFTPDAAILNHRTRHFIRCLPVYDLCVTQKSWEVDLYCEEGSTDTIYVPKSANFELFRPVDVSGSQNNPLRSDVCFIGHCEPSYARYVKAAYDTGCNVAVWGRWEKELKNNAWIKNVFRGSGIWQEDYVRALCCAKIGLGLLTKGVPEKSTCRSIQIPACGTMLLAERTDEHQSFFEEDKEAVFFGDENELKEKIKYYLANPKQREAIALAGMKRCHESGYGYTDRMQQCLEHVSRPA